MRDEKEYVKTAVAAGKFTRERDYWLSKLAGSLEKSIFSYDLNRKNQNQRKMEAVRFDFSGQLFQQLLKSSKNSDARLHIILVAGLVALLNKYTGNNGILVGTPIYRQDREGEFINTVLTLRNWLSPHMTFKELVLTVKDTISKAVENQNYAIEVLLQNLGLPYSGEDFPLFDVGLLVENIQLKEYLRHIHLNLIFCFRRNPGGIQGEVEYNSSLYKTSSIEQIISGYSRLLNNALNHVDLPLAQVDILTEEEKKRLLMDFNDTGTINRFIKPIHELFQEQANKTPDNTAVTDAAVTYGELNRRANRVAHWLKREGITTESVVGIMMEPSVDMVVNLMGILKTGGAYLPIDTDTPGERIGYMLEDSGAKALVTTGEAIKDISFTTLQGFEKLPDLQVTVTPLRPHIAGFDRLPHPNRRLINLEKYKDKIGMASVTNCMSIQATRGCPYHCLFCHKIWSKHHIYRSAENIYSEIEYYYQNGVTHFAFIDDCFNLNIEKSRQVFEAILKNQLKVRLFFPNGLRGDILTPDYIDLMVEAGTRGINLSLETGSPRLQKLLRKNLDLEKFKQVMDYIASRHPDVILEMASMHGFPGETKEEAMMTLNFIKDIKWLHFPYIHILKIFPNTEMEAFALKQGVSKRDIMISKDRAFHELPETLPFPKSFTRKYQADFLNNYFLNKERLMQVLPHQMKVLSEAALVQKYNAYLPVEIKRIEDLIEFTQLEDLRVPDGYREEKDLGETMFDWKAEKQEIKPGAKKILLLDLSQHFSSFRMLYRVVEQPLGLIYLLTHLKEQFGDKIDGRIYKSGDDFDSFAELKALVDEYRPDLVGVRTLTFFKEFFHETISLLRQWGVKAPIITGGPYASSDYDTILKDKNVNLVLLGEGEYTLEELIREMLKKDFQLPGPDILARIRGIAYPVKIQENDAVPSQSRQVILLERLKDLWLKESMENLEPLPGETNLAYVMYTSGSTGKPKGVMVEHGQVNNCISWMQDKFNLEPGNVVVNRTNLTFDPSVWEIFWPLTTGAAIKILDVYQRKDAEFLIRLMAEDITLTMMYCPATLVNIMTYLLNKKSEKPRLKLPWFIIGAEPIAMEMVREFYQYFEGRIVNTYGPTEGTINNTYYHIPRDDNRAVVPIGKPIANNRIYILDGNLQPVPLKIPGEICIAGDSLARGYLNKPQLTAEKFCLRRPGALFEKTAPGPHKNFLLEGKSGQGTHDKEDLLEITPLNSESFPGPYALGPRLYKTGDMGRWLEDGVIEIMGRVDEQVKIRGHRIELGEVQSVLSRHPAVSDCIVVVKNSDEYKKVTQTCKMCGITDRYPNVEVNPDRICNICEFYTRNQPYIDNYFKTPEQLKQVIQKASKNKVGQYHCLLLFAGGRGAAYALYQLVDIGFNVLALTYDNGYFSKADLENIKKITASLGVDHVVLEHKHSDKILGESIKSAATVCRGCFHTSSSLAGEYAYKHDIPVVVGATLSRGQIIENKLLMFLQQGITAEKELEKEISRFQRSAPLIDRAIFAHIDISEVTTGVVYDKVKFVDFYRYFNITNREMIDFLNQRDPYWLERKTYAIYSTNCPIKQIGDFGHLREKGYHYYGGATSWEKRLGHLTLEDLKEDLSCKVTEVGYGSFLKRIGLQPVTAVETPDKYLCAYYVLGEILGTDGDLTASLKDYLATHLPSYMVPNHFVQLDKIPLTSNGKVDKKALPEPRRIAAASSTYVAPKTDMEKIVADIWKEVLKVDRPGAADNFFDLGGNSLDIIMVGSKLKAGIGREIPIVTLFTYPTIRGLAVHLSEEGTGEPLPLPDKNINSSGQRLDSVQERKSRLKQSRQKRQQNKAVNP